MATLSLFEDYSVDNFSKSFLANKLKVDYDKLDSLVLSHLEKLKVIKIQAWIHHTQGSSEKSISVEVDGPFGPGMKVDPIIRKMKYISTTIFIIFSITMIRSTFVRLNQVSFTRVTTLKNVNIIF